MTRRKLRGEHCQCGGREEYFNSLAAFDKHRAGDYGVNRRCLSPEEMRNKGMAVSKSGWWVTSINDNADSRFNRGAVSASEQGQARGVA